MGQLAVMGRSGDTRIIWSANNAAEVAAARATFDTLIRAGHSAFAVKNRGGQGERVTAFDPHAEKLILVPAMVGG